MKHLPRQTRWAAPIAVVLAAGSGLLAGSARPSAAAAPRLPARSAGQLLAALTGDGPETPAARHCPGRSPRRRRWGCLPCRPGCRLS